MLRVQNADGSCRAPVPGMVISKYSDSVNTYTVLDFGHFNEWLGESCVKVLARNGETLSYPLASWFVLWYDPNSVSALEGTN